uniref:Uncharacterized protein n=1 Tax=Phaeomonas parva TaxID=124430 RepID=A0A7S1XPL2_9STRA|mmetsp:Transcript_22194/g.68273  ORF Transcript_22194/g.68273 Transcript_22194/m.68273 type:complete len:168 (+) Transcript_22194:965-1468(+)
MPAQDTDQPTPIMRELNLRKHSVERSPAVAPAEDAKDITKLGESTSISDLARRNYVRRQLLAPRRLHSTRLPGAGEFRSLTAGVAVENRRRVASSHAFNVDSFIDELEGGRQHGENVRRRRWSTGEVARMEVLSETPRLGTPRDDEMRAARPLMRKPKQYRLVAIEN